MNQSNPAPGGKDSPSSSEEEGRGNSGEGKDPSGGLYPPPGKESDPQDKSEPPRRTPDANEG